MKKLVILVAALISSSAMATEMCHVLTKSNTWVTEPCTETPIPCAKEWTDEKGYRHSEAAPCAPGEQKTVEQVQREDEKELKRKCGKDYMRLRIGMTIDRLEQCYGATYVTETVSKGGVIETYRTTFDWVHVKNDRVISYTRRTR